MSPFFSKLSAKLSALLPPKLSAQWSAKLSVLRAKYYPEAGRHRGRSAAARNARTNLVVAVGVVGLVAAAIVYAVAISDGAARPDEAALEIPKWWSAEQAAHGAELYAQHCAECHGGDGEGAAAWREKDSDGNYPPPPLNGAAHTWHHDLGALRRTIRFGGQPLGGVMPGFGDELSAEDIDAVLAHIQSLWPEEVYLRWRVREERRQR